jgi:hypothetical protein
MADEAEPGGFSQSPHGGEAIEGRGGGSRHGMGYHRGETGARRTRGGCLFADVGK